ERAFMPARSPGSIAPDAEAVRVKSRETAARTGSTGRSTRPPEERAGGRHLPASSLHEDRSIAPGGARDQRPPAAIAYSSETAGGARGTGALSAGGTRPSRPKIRVT